ncbi:Hsp20/alpha crystallin family protein [Gracilibacillus sp. YIM 98692]|uniref:Hsp20/alpha crystallin family protein n=1 Tax=Gracilibacillus sp. YIM 98692 TaxID=2663532 RepID=UPI001F09CBB9|nr:Hsp20/alpha crystallin family protein [Gracilibacillus sp. YIM 98692]
MAFVPNNRSNQQGIVNRSVATSTSDFGQMSIDINETENEILAICNLPGLESKEDVQIDIQNNMLTISGSIHKTNELKEDNMHQTSSYASSFQQSLSLPSPVSQRNVETSYQNGVLEIRMPKSNHS